MLSQLVFHQVDNVTIDYNQVDSGNEENYINILLSFANAILIFGLIIACSSTFVIFKNWIAYNQRINDLESTTLDAELQLLKNQINPHFLFNMLNNAKFMMKKDPKAASQMLIKLDDLLCYQIEDSAKNEVFLSGDIAFLADYLELEKSRRDRFEYNISSKNGDVKEIKVPPLLFIPFVENAAKHSPESRNISHVHISFNVQDGRLLFHCSNTKPKVPLKKTIRGGLGLANIKRRLELLYGEDYSLQLIEEETTYTVNLELKL